MNKTIEELCNRKSVRIYEDKVIEEEKKQLILEASLQAPSAGNMTLYSIIDVQDQSIKDRLAILCDNQPFIATAPLVLVYVADYQKWYDGFKNNFGEDVRKPSYGDFLLAYSDALIAAQNSVVAAESMGIGSCYIGDVIENFEEVKELLNLPKYTAPVAMLVMGYPAVSQINRKKPVRFNLEDVVFTNQYHQLNAEELTNMFDKRANKTNRQGIDDLTNIYNRKWTDEFIEEMSRSAKKWIDNWSK